MRSPEYTLTVFYRHGVFSRSCDYMELYRVVDFREHRSFLQHAMPVDYLFAADKVFGTAQVDESVQ